MKPEQTLCGGDFCDGLIWCLTCCNTHVSDKPLGGSDCWCCGSECDQGCVCLLCLYCFPFFYGVGCWTDTCRACLGAQSP